MLGTRYDCLVPSPDGTLLMIVRDGDAWTLPSVVCERGWLAEVVEELTDQFRERYGIDAAVLRIIQWLPSNVTCELEARGGAPAGATWVSPGDPIIDALPAGQADAVRHWSAGRGHERQLSPWQFAGWLDEARDWIASHVEIEDLRQVKAGWNGSCVLRVRTPSATLYFKASRTSIPGEAAIVQLLSESWPQHVPSLVAADTAHNWMLMRELRSTPIDSRNAADLADVARFGARMQLGEARRIDRWLALGCPDRGLAALERSLDLVLRDLPQLLHDAGVITAGERDAIASFDAAARCRALAGYAIPPLSIFHEDFRDGNAQRTAGGAIVVLDWNDVLVAHPFFMLHRFLWYMPVPPGHRRYEIGDGDQDVLRRTVRDAYLAELTALESPARLLEAFAVSLQLAPVFDAYCLASRQDLAETFAPGLTPEEQRIARMMMEQILSVCS